jgi:ATP-dependent helicase/nuclease subunit A
VSRAISFPHTVIRASAGTGKTYQLSSRFIGLLAAGVPPGEILATTFTRKAAGEIQDRVLLRLARAASDDQECAGLAAAIGDERLTRARARKLLVETVRALHTLRIGTLDSFFLQLAGGFALELGLPAGWTICDELADERIRERAIEELLARGKLPELLTLMNLLAKGQAVRSISRIVRDTVTDLFGLFRQSDGPAWEQVLPPKGLSAEELQDVLDRLAALPMPQQTWTKANQESLELAQLGDWENLISKGIAVKVLQGEAQFNRKAIPEEVAALYRSLLDHAASILVGLIAHQTQATQRLLARYASEYIALQHQERSLRFDDVAHRLAAAVDVHGPPRLAFRMDGGIRHLLLDEFQDTAPVQWQVLRPLAKGITTGGGSFFCVGDAKQAIYGWRGGVAAIFDALDGELTGLTGATLATSYRSAQPVMDAVNQVFQNLGQHPNLDKLAEGVRQWQDQFPSHTTTKTDLPGYVRLEFAPPPAEDEDATDKLFEFAAAQVARHVQEAPKCSVGVLVRTNVAVARMIYLLRKLGVPASEEGGNPLIDSPAVEIILSLLKLADHPGDRVARFHLGNSPLARALELSDQHDDAAAAQLARKTRRELLDQGYGAFVFAWARRLAEHCDARDQSRLQQLVELAYEYQPASTLRTVDFIRLIERRKVADPSSADVRVMTIHQAKGLEFDVVVLPELSGSLTGQPVSVVAGRPRPTEPVEIVCRYANEATRRFLPPRLQALFEESTASSVAESLCVLYVAMTRAVHCLHMILASPKPSEKSLHKTYAGVLRATLGQGLASNVGVVYERGDRHWFARLDKRPALLAATESAPRGAICFAPPLAKRERGLERTSPSSLEGGSKVSVQRLLDTTAAAAFEYGSLIHGWLAEVQWLEDGLPDDDLLRSIAIRMAPQWAGDGRQLAAKVAAFQQQLAAPQVSAALHRSAYAELLRAAGGELSVYTERAFTLRSGDELLSGSIDRLVLTRRGGKVVAADVLDYKTDAIDPHDSGGLAERIEFYRPQIEAYRRAVAQLFQLDFKCITARLVFLHAGLVRELK